MKLKGLITSITSIIFLGLPSCQKDNNTTIQPEEVVMNISSPISEQVYKAGQQIPIKATINYTSTLHGYIVRIKNEEGSLIFETEGHAHGENIEVDEVWTNNVNASVNLTLELITVINHENSETKKTVGFYSQP